MEPVVFHEDWYPETQLSLLAEVYDRVRLLEGAVLEIGCWEGRSTAALARACYPTTLLAIDTWMGNINEDANHPTVQAARDRDVFAIFLANMKALEIHNVSPV